MQHSRFLPTLIVLGLLVCLAGGWSMGADSQHLVFMTGTYILATAIAILGTTAFASVSWFGAKAELPAPLGERKRSVFSDMAGSVLIVGPTGSINWVNQAFANLLGRTPEELRGTAFPDLMGAKAWQSLLACDGQIQAGDAIQISGGMTRSDGSEAWVSGYANLLLNNDDSDDDNDDGDHPNGENGGELVIQLVDVSNYRETHASLLRSVSQYRHVVDTSDELIIMVDFRGQVLQANPAAVAVLNRGIALTDRSILDFIEASERADFIELMKKTHEDTEVHELSRLTLLAAGSANAEFNDESTLTVSARGVTLPVSGGEDNSGSIIRYRILDDQLASERAAEEELRMSEARFSRIFHSSPDSILIVRHEDSTILDFNAGFTQLLGYSREDAIGQPEPNLGLWVHGVERERILHMLATHNECSGIETKLRCKNDTQVYVEISLRYIEIEGDLCILCIGRDISKRSLAETALKESQDKFATVFSRSPDGIVIIRQKDLTIYDINDVFSKGSGYSHEQLVGASLSDLDVFANQKSLPNAVEQLAHDGQFSNVEMMFKTKFGQEIPTLVSATTIEIGEEPCVLCIAKDVRDLRSTQERLRVSEERFRGAFENAPIGIMLLDMDGRIFQANRFVAELLDFGDNAMNDLHVSTLVPSDERAHYQEILQRLAHGGEESLRIEQRMLCASGKEIWTNMHMVLQHDRDGGPSYCIVQIADVTEMKVSQQRMERMAFYDNLTDLANRRLFYDRLAHAIDHAARSQRLSALLYLDLDQFKRVNDTLGHEAGDVLLRAVAERLTASVRAEDTVGRPGGDEFTILLYDVGTPSDASHVAEKILDLLQQPITISGQQLVITTSIGITILPTDGTDPKALMKNADLAMYRAKERGRNQFQFYSEEMNTDASNRLKIEYELRRALEQDQFELYYQPKIRLADQQAVGVECLLRWHHPERGLILPGDFIQVAEETGAIVDIGKWVIEAACLAAAQLCATNQTPICTAVNVSPRQFRDPELVATVQRCLRQSGLNPNHLELEITETMLMQDVEAASQTLQQLHDLGVRLAIDDFGTGYSSLNYLKKFPIDTVKVDRSFVMDIPNSTDDMAITAAVIAMAHQLNMEVVAEGVETPEQLEFLKLHECEYAQGFLFSKAVPLREAMPIFAPNVRLLRGQ
jgi:diguanylate cyclase (GGDEF)-like protein/PAS domain S-box-containing protein